VGLGLGSVHGAGFIETITPAVNDGSSKRENRETVTPAL
jgi:hypothetical protein